MRTTTKNQICELLRYLHPPPLTSQTPSLRSIVVGVGFQEVIKGTNEWFSWWFLNFIPIDKLFTQSFQCLLQFSECSLKLNIHLRQFIDFNDCWDFGKWKLWIRSKAFWTEYADCCSGWCWKLLGFWVFAYYCGGGCVIVKVFVASGDFDCKSGCEGEEDRKGGDE